MSVFRCALLVQFYKATSNGVVTNQDVNALREQIDRVYAEGDYVGSSVTGGYTERPTEWQLDPKETIWGNPIWSWHKSY